MVNIHDNFVSARDFECLSKLVPTMYSQEITGFMVEMPAQKVKSILKTDMDPWEKGDWESISYTVEPVDADALDWLEKNETHPSSEKVRTKLVKRIFGSLKSEADLDYGDLKLKGLFGIQDWFNALNACNIQTDISFNDFSELRYLERTLHPKDIKTALKYESSRAWVDGKSAKWKWDRNSDQIVCGLILTGILLISVTFRYWVRWLFS